MTLRVDESEQDSSEEENQPESVTWHGTRLGTWPNLTQDRTYVVKLFPHLNINGVFFLFAGTCVISGVFVYFLCPETKGLVLEDIEYLFHPGVKKPGVSPRYVEVETPVQNV
ncbi:Sugar transport protein 10 [Globisporangium polare]